MITFEDVGLYVGQVRRAKGMTLNQFQKAVNLSPSFLSRLETGTMERVKLADAFAIDRALVENGEIIGMYWHAGQVGMRLNRYPKRRGWAGVPSASWTRREWDLVVILIKIGRWFQCLIPQQTEWLVALRAMTKTSGKADIWYFQSPPAKLAGK